MATSDAAAKANIINAERVLIATICAVIASLDARAGMANAPIAALLCAVGLAAPTMPFALRSRAPALAVDFACVFIFAALVDPSGVLWRAPQSLAEIFRLTPVGAFCATLFYSAGVLTLGVDRMPTRLALFLIPFIFCLLIALGGDAAVQLGSAVSFGLTASRSTEGFIGRALILFVFNEAVVIGAPIALQRFLPKEWRPHSVLAFAAIGAAATPIIADLAAVEAHNLPALAAPIAALAGAALAQAGLWGETYLVTQSLAGLLRATPSLSVVVYHDWRTGALKGAVYGLVFMATLLATALLLALPGFVGLMSLTNPVSATLLGAGLYPLLRAIMESTDSTPPFFRRLLREYERPSNFARGAALGAAAGVALAAGLPAAPSSLRFAYGAAAGALAFAGVDAASDFFALLRARRQHLRSWRVYALGAMLGGVVGGAIAWYLDVGQIDTIVAKFRAYVAIDYAAEGRAISSYVIRPLFSKWGATDLGSVAGGVTLFYDESLSGVIQWVFAAPLFSINLFFLTALIQRSTRPLKQLASLEGLDMLVENAVRVLRWGLWMAPIIYSFLKASPDPTWYNQDGLVRSFVATWLANTLPDDQFRAWSLDIFTALLAFDALRVLIWFDHMGLRVATLVNLSFVGGDILDEKASRFIGKSQVSRAIPEGIRRFATWAPLLLPFYIPRGAEWDKAWSAAETLAKAQSPAYLPLLSGYLSFAGALAAALVLYLLVQLARAGRLTFEGVTGIGGVPGSQPMRLTNGLVTSEWFEDAQGVLRIEGVERGGPPIDLTRRPDDPAHPRGRFLFIREDGGELWSLGASPTCCTAKFARLETEGQNGLSFVTEHNDIRVEALVTLASSDAVEVMRLKICNLQNVPRILTLATLREWVLNETGVELRDAAYNAIHIGSWYVRALNAVIAQNRLLKGGARRASDRRLSPEVGFHAMGPLGDTRVTVVGYEDVKSRFYGLGSTARPDSLLGFSSPRDCADEGLLYGFEPIASLQVSVDLAANGVAEIVIVDGWAANMGAATDLIAQHLGVPPVAPAILDRALSKRRSLVPPPLPAKPRFAFAPDGRSIVVDQGTPRPFAHVIANAHGAGCVLTNDGEIFSFSGNSRLNSLTPFRLGEGRMAPAGQAVYVYDLAHKECFSPTFTPLRRRDAAYRVEYGLGLASFSASRDRLDLELTVFASASEPVEYRLLRLINNSDAERLLQVTPALEIVLGETPNETLGVVESRCEDDLSALYFRNPQNRFVEGWAFVSTSLPAEFAETSRRRFLGHESRSSPIPYMVEHGHPDAGSPEHQRKIASFSGAIDVPAHGEALVVIALGQVRSLTEAQALARKARDPDHAMRELEAAREDWRKRLSVLRIKTNRPEFDRLVNDWLPYQLFASRLWGRTGPAQRSGATGYRDQLQDVIPLAHLAPERARAQILLHAAHQYIEGDACKWWHRAPDGGTGLADRTHASDPHLWLPYVALKYVKGTGDAEIFDAVEPFLEAELTPKDQEGQATVPLASRDRDTLLGHCARAIDYTLARMGAHGLPLMGAGDWDDGMNAVGEHGVGESAWLGFFLHGILIDIAPVFEAKGDAPRAQRYVAAAQALRSALDRCWRGDRYLRAYADNGEILEPMSAMTASWPALSGAVDDQRGRETIENALATLARKDRILLVSPPYTEHSRPYPGRSAEYPPGIRENGGQYSHGVSWFVDALAILASRAHSRGERAEAEALFAKAVEAWTAISPLSKFGSLEEADIYGLPPHQQVADVYDGEGYSGRGGWAWYTGSAARMISAAYALLGVEFENGQLKLRPDAFDEKGGLQLESVSFRGETTARDGKSRS